MPVKGGQRAATRAFGRGAPAPFTLDWHDKIAADNGRRGAPQYHLPGHRAGGRRAHTPLSRPTRFQGARGGHPPARYGGAGGHPPQDVGRTRSGPAPIRMGEGLRVWRAGGRGERSGAPALSAGQGPPRDLRARSGVPPGLRRASSLPLYLSPPPGPASAPRPRRGPPGGRGGAPSPPQCRTTSQATERTGAEGSGL